MLSLLSRYSLEHEIAEVVRILVGVCWERSGASEEPVVSVCDRAQRGIAHRGRQAQIGSSVAERHRRDQGSGSGPDMARVDAGLGRILVVGNGDDLPRLT